MTKKKKSLTKALGLKPKNKQPEALRKAVAAGAGKDTRFKPGDNSKQLGTGQKLQILPPRLIAKERKNLLEDIANLSGEFVSSELQEALKIQTTDGEPVTFSTAVAYALHFAAIRGDVQAVKTILEAQSQMKSPANGKPPHIMQIEFVEEEVCPQCKLCADGRAREVKEAANETTQSSD